MPTILWRCYDLDNNPDCEGDPVLIEAERASDAAREFVAMHLGVEDGHVAEVLVSSGVAPGSRFQVERHVRWEFPVTELPACKL
jgi:hypothetical protein